jgi:ABC-type molybdate transport system ATPase subunit
MEVGCGDLSIIVPHDGNSVHRIAIFPHDIYISETKPPGPEVNRFRGTIIDITSVGEAVKIRLKVGETYLMAEMPYHIFEDMNLAVSMEVFLILKLRRIRVYENRNI